MYRFLPHKVVVFSFFAVVLDITVAPFIRLGGIQPFFSYLLILYSAFCWGLHRTLPVSFLVGLLRDLTSSHLIGTETLTLVMLSLMLHVLLHKLDKKSLIVRGVASFLFVMGALTVTLLLSSLTGRSSWPVDFGALGYAFRIAFYTTLLSPLFFAFVSRLLKERRSLREYGEG